MLRSRAAKWSVAGVLAVVVLLGLWVAWQVWQVNKDLSESVRRAEAIQRAVEARDPGAIDKELAGLREASSSAVERTDGLTWSALEVVPVFGDDAEGIAVTAGVIDDLARDGIEPLAEVSDRFDDLLPKDGAIDVDVVADMAGPVARAEQAFVKADATLAEQDSSGYLGRFKEKFTDFRDRVDSAAAGLRSARIATDVLPTMLGADGPRHYLLAFENNAEVRGTGGLYGAVSYVEADRGRLAIRNHVAAASLGESKQPVLPLSAAEKELYGPALGTYLLNAGMTPDVPRAADLMRARWELEFPKQPVDGVLVVDAVAISYLLDATGPVTVDGVELTGDNVVDELLHESYLRLSNPADQDAFFAKVAAVSFERFTTGSGDATAMVKALARASDERRVFVHSFEAAEQANLAGTAVAGEVVPADDATPRIDVTLNDTTGAKMSYYLRYEVQVTPTSCARGVQNYTAKARLRSEAPQDAAQLPNYITGGGDYGIDPGSQLVTVRVFAPAGGELGEMDLNGEPMDLVRVEQDGRPVGMTYLQLDPGQTVDLAWTMRSGSGQVGDTMVAITPTIEKKDGALELTSACGGN